MLKVFYLVFFGPYFNLQSEEEDIILTHYHMTNRRALQIKVMGLDDLDRR